MPRRDVVIGEDVVGDPGVGEHLLPHVGIVRHAPVPAAFAGDEPQRALGQQQGHGPLGVGHALEHRSQRADFFLQGPAQCLRAAGHRVPAVLAPLAVEIAVHVPVVERVGGDEARRHPGLADGVVRRGSQVLLLSVRLGGLDGNVVQPQRRLIGLAGAAHDERCLLQFVPDDGGVRGVRPGTACIQLVVLPPGLNGIRPDAHVRTDGFDRPGHPEVVLPVEAAALLPPPQKAEGFGRGAIDAVRPRFLAGRETAHDVVVG